MKANLQKQKKDKLWVLGIINNTDKNFRLECTIKRDTVTLTNFVKKYVEPGNTIVSDGWPAYSNLNEEGYYHNVHIHGGGDFGFGLNSISTIESLWHALKVKIQTTYRTIPSLNFISYLREAEWKYPNKDKSYQEKIKEFFECVKFLNDVSDVNLKKNEFLSDSEINDDSNDDQEDLNDSEESD